MASEQDLINPKIEEIKEQEDQAGANRPPSPIPQVGDGFSSWRNPESTEDSSPVQSFHSASSTSFSSSSNLSSYSTPSPPDILPGGEPSFRIGAQGTAPPGYLTPPRTYTHYPPTSNHPTNIPALDGIFNRIPVQQHFSGPTNTVISVFSEPGTYTIQANFQQQPDFDGVGGYPWRY